VCLCRVSSRSHGLYRGGRGTQVRRTIPPDMAEETSQTLPQPTRVLPQESRRTDRQRQRRRGTVCVFLARDRFANIYDVSYLLRMH